MTLRLSSACSNQLSYAPASAEASAGCHVGSAGPFAPVPNSSGTKFNGADEVRTRDLLLAKQALSQLSYGPVRASLGPLRPRRSSLQCLLLAKNIRSSKTGLCDTFELPDV